MRKKTHSFMFMNQKVVLKTMTLSEIGKCQIQKSTKVVEGMKSSLQILTKKTFQYESKENEVLYAVVMKEVNLLDAGNISSIPNKATQLFNDVSDTTNRVA